MRFSGRVARALPGIALLLVSPLSSTGQELEQAKAMLPAFTSTAQGQSATLHIYYPSADLTVKLEASAASGLFSDLEFGYLVGDLASVVSDYLANVWYGEYDEATIASAAQQLEEQAKTMKQPFQRPKAGISVAMDASGLTLNFSGVAADGVTEVSTSFKLTWTQVLEAQ